MLVLAGCDVPELFESLEELLYKVQIPIDPAREHRRALAISLRRELAQALRSAAMAGMALLSYPYRPTGCLPR